MSGIKSCIYLNYKSIITTLSSYVEIIEMTIIIKGVYNADQFRLTRLCVPYVTSDVSVHWIWFFPFTTDSQVLPLKHLGLFLPHV